MDRKEKLKKVAAIAVAYYLNQSKYLNDKPVSNYNWKRVNSRIHMENRISVAQKFVNVL